LGSNADLSLANPEPTGDLRTIGRVNDQAYGNIDARLERTLTTLKEDDLRAYRVDLNGAPASVALALHHGEDCGVSFVATLPQARRRGLATQVMRAVLADAHRHDLTTITLQATEQGERLYAQLGLHRLGTMELWEHRQLNLNPRSRTSTTAALRQPPRSPIPASIRCPHCGYAAFYNPKPVACASRDAAQAESGCCAGLRPNVG
jgi:GNAT superfamily N-acetyltransferase